MARELYDSIEVEIVQCHDEVGTMSIGDVVVTLPVSFGLDRWVGEGDPAGSTWSGEEWGWFMGGKPPTKTMPGDRVYVVHRGHLIGFSPLIRIQPTRQGGFAFIRRGDASAVTIPGVIAGFRGWRYRWWDRAIEVPFPEWATAAKTDKRVSDGAAR